MKQLMIFAASWCGPCKSLKQTISGSTLPVTDIQTIDVDESPELAKEYGVRGVPTVFVVEDGKPVRSKTGAMTLEQLLTLIGD